MKFNICYRVVLRRGYFIHQRFYLYTTPFINLLVPGAYKPIQLLWKTYILWFDLHYKWHNIYKSPAQMHGDQSVYFGIHLINSFLSFSTPEMLYTWRVVRLFKILTYRGKRISQGLPANGQRSHSNSSYTAVRKRWATEVNSTGRPR